MVRNSACVISLRVVNISGPMPPSHHSEPNARQTSPGPGRLSHGDTSQTMNATAAHSATRPMAVARSTARLGRKMRARRPGSALAAAGLTGAPGGGGAGAGAGAAVDIYICAPVPSTISTRRFLARPSEVELESSGSVEPWANTLVRSAGKFAFD